MIDRQGIRRRWASDGSKRDERGRRLFAASEARAAGWGGLAAVSEISGLARSTIERGLKDLDAPSPPAGRIRRDGGGPRPLTKRDPTLLDALRRLVEPATLGDPVRPLLWVSKSLDKLAASLSGMGHSISPDRNAQFDHINAEVVAAQAAGQPVVSVDTKKKELIGNYRNGGTDYRPKGAPRRVKVHDFEDKNLGKVAPYGVYDIAANSGWVSVGITHDTAEFAVSAIATWLKKMGRRRYPEARQLTITADCGGSNGARVRLWKVELQKFADRTGLGIKVLHYPPGTSKWNRIEHRMFCHITQNWRGRPLADRATVVELIAATTTKTGLKIKSALDTKTYEKGIKVSKAEMDRIDIRGDTFHPEWNYTIMPRTAK